jgi:thymidylate synthase
MNKYHQLLTKIINEGKRNANKKGDNIYLLNQQMQLKPIDLLEIFEGHLIARNKLRNELELFRR